MKQFLLEVGQKNSRLMLMENGVILEERSWAESRDMGRQLFQGIDELLRENALKPGDIDDFQVKTDVSDNFTSVKIAQTVQKTFLFANKETGHLPGE